MNGTVQRGSRHHRNSQRACCRPTRLALTHAAAGAMLMGLVVGGARAQTVVNPVSAFDIIVDGKFTGGINSNGTLNGEWSDITPLAFISPATNAGTLFSVPVGDPRANSLLYAGLDPGKDNLYLMYDYLPRTSNVFAPGEQFASIAFPVDLPKNSTFGQSGRRTIDVQFSEPGNQGLSLNPGLGFIINVHSDANGNDPAFTVSAASLGMTGAVGFGPSTLSSIDHLLIELEVPLEIPANFVDAKGNSGFPGNGIDPVGGGSAGYSPDPAFWNGDFANNNVDPPASSALFQIDPLGNTLITPNATPAATPEPTALAAAVCGGVAGLFALRRRRQAQPK